jgi:hypothetical protein
MQSAPHAIRRDGLLGEFLCQGALDQRGRDLEQLARQTNQLRPGQATMAIAHGLGQSEGDPCAHADHRGLLDTQLLGDQVGGAEADAADVLGQPVGVLAHHLHGVGAVGLEDPHGPGRAHAMLVQEDHDLPDHLLVGPAGGDPGRTHRANARRPRAGAPARPR